MPRRIIPGSVAFAFSVEECFWTDDQILAKANSMLKQCEFKKGGRKEKEYASQLAGFVGQMELRKRIRRS